VNAGAMMVADDLALTADDHLKLKHAINIAEMDASKQRYSFNVDKNQGILEYYSIGKLKRFTLISFPIKHCSEYMKSYQCACIKPILANLATICIYNNRCVLEL
jgi:hypothetical protein